MTLSRKLLTAAVILISLALLVPGITQPILSLSGSIEKSEISAIGIDLLVGEPGEPTTHEFLTAISALLGLDQIEGQLVVYQSTRSIAGTVESLATSGNLLVAFLVVFFSVVIPVFKLLLLLCSLLVSSTELRRPALWLNATLSKWSMADVFAMALLVAFLAGNASDQMGNLLIMDAQLGSGFYFFLGYCLFSIAASALTIEKGSE